MTRKWGQEGVTGVLVTHQMLKSTTMSAKSSAILCANSEPKWNLLSVQCMGTECDLATPQCTVHDGY